MKLTKLFKKIKINCCQIDEIRTYKINLKLRMDHKLMVI